MSAPDAVAIQIDTWSMWTSGVLSLLHFILLILVFSSNLLVIYAVVTNKSLHLAPHYFIASLALSDLLMALGPIPLAGLYLFYGYWPYVHSASCASWIGFRILLGSASMYNLASISMDRLIACLQPIRYKTTLSGAHVIPLITISWTVPIVLLFISLLTGPISSIDAGGCHSRLNLHFRLAIFSAGFGIPCIVITCSNLCVLRAIRKHYRTNIMGRYKPRSVTLNFVGRRAQIGTLPDRCDPPMRTSETESSSRQFHLSLTNTHHPYTVPPLAERHALSPHFVLDVSVLICANYFHSSMIRNFTKHYFRHRVSTNGSIEDPFRLLARNQGSIPMVQLKSIGSITVLERTLPIDIQADQTEISQLNVPVKAQCIQRQSTASDSSPSNRYPVLPNEYSREQQIGASFRPNSGQRMYRMMLVVIFCYIICWSACVICSLTEAARGLSMSRFVTGSSLWLGFVNSACNPIIYGLLDKRYRKTFKHVIRCCFSR
ncbi:hypothetical protein D915_003517 [Fasciola hepatica]|uniref:G-protein coupled receptors family 1 profile domain-containing protein n=1 Tax=Fasciola hepatica TaxID=6192 RepID=A0A4E0RDW8_FASHE|nr:hypothetical protein D915_003517 [Fasciola hepatica]